MRNFCPKQSSLYLHKCMIDWLTEDVKYAETALSRVNAQNLLWNFHINAMGPVLVSKVLL